MQIETITPWQETAKARAASYDPRLGTSLAWQVKKPLYDALAKAKKRYGEMSKQYVAALGPINRVDRIDYALRFHRHLEHGPLGRQLAARGITPEMLVEQEIAEGRL